MSPSAHPFIIDLEASGFGVHSYPIEVGYALEPDQRYSMLIHPHTEWTYWDDAAEKIHGVSREVLHTSGHPLTEVAEKLNQDLAGLTLYSDGWVVDSPWLKKLFFAAKMEMQFSVSPLENILKEPQMEIWHETKEQLLEEMQIIRHRASYDAWLIQETYKRTLQQTVVMTDNSFA